MKKKFYAATVSTFTADNHPDVDSMAAIADRVVSRGGDGLFILGTMGEWNQLSAAESEAMISGVSAALVGRGELLAGISGTGLDLTLQNLERASRYECAAYVVVLPPVRMSQLPPVEYLRTVMDHADRPVYYYHAPMNNGITLSENDFSMLAEHPRFAGVKNSAGEMVLRKRLLRLRNRYGFSLFEGNEWAVDEALILGCDGVVCGIGALAPAGVIEIVRAVEAGEYERAMEVQMELTRVFEAVYGCRSWIGEKYALKRLGVIADCRCRIQPESMLTADHRARIERCLEEHAWIFA